MCMLSLKNNDLEIDYKYTKPPKNVFLVHFMKMLLSTTMFNRIVQITIKLLPVFFSRFLDVFFVQQNNCKSNKNAFILKRK